MKHKRKNRLLRKQLWKYGLIIVVALTGIFFGKIIWSLPTRTIYWGFGIGAGILLISLIFDAISLQDVIPILKR